MIVNDTEYGYTIEPSYGKVRAEIYKLMYLEAHPEWKPLQIHLDSKNFSGVFRRTNRQDFVDAREWADQQLKNIYHANK